MLHVYAAVAPYVVVVPPPRPPLTVAAPAFVTVGAAPQFVIAHVGAADHVALVWHVAFEPDFVYPVLQVYAAVALIDVVVPPAAPPLTLAAPAFVTVGATGQNEAIAPQVGAADHVPFAWHVGLLPLFA